MAGNVGELRSDPSSWLNFCISAVLSLYKCVNLQSLGFKLHTHTWLSNQIAASTTSPVKMLNRLFWALAPFNRLSMRVVGVSQSKLPRGPAGISTVDEVSSAKFLQQIGFVQFASDPTC